MQLFINTIILAIDSIVFVYFISFSETVVNGGWSDWGTFGACNKNCGIGKKFRFRSCTNPTPSTTGIPCVGSSSESLTCESRKCPGITNVLTVDKYMSKTEFEISHFLNKMFCTNCNFTVDGGWSAYSSFSTCSAECGRGTQTRHRQCNNPKPQHNGRQCPGPATHTRTCNTQSCAGIKREKIVVSFIRLREFYIFLLFIHTISFSTFLQSTVSGIIGETGRPVQGIVEEDNNHAKEPEIILL